MLLLYQLEANSLAPIRAVDAALAWCVFENRKIVNVTKERYVSPTYSVKYEKWGKEFLQASTSTFNVKIPTKMQKIDRGFYC